MGFPQNSGGSFFYHSGEGENQVHIPTLSELVEACGEDMYRLWQVKYMMNNLDAKGWIAENLEYKGKDGLGKTLEEAVAKLWLELNKKEDGD